MLTPPQNLSRRQLERHSSDVRQAFLKVCRISLFDGQLRAGQLLTSRTVVEMATGEGKTFTAALPLLAYAQETGHVWLATANDYLARRDSELLRPVLEELGLSVGAVWEGLNSLERQQAYRRTITYGTLREFAFDYLKQRIALREQPSASPLWPDPRDVALIVDECDSLLIDEARTPFVISGPGPDIGPDRQSCFRWAGEFVRNWQRQTHYQRVDGRGSVALTNTGLNCVLEAMLPPEVAPLPLVDILHAVERAVLVQEDFRRDEHYLIREGEIAIVDDATGRIGEGRRWNGGIQQAIEARETLSLSNSGRTAAQITVQEFVQKFRHLSGMTGTAQEAATEFWKVYGLKVTPVAPRQPVRRRMEPTFVARSQAAKWNAVVDDCSRIMAQGRPVLVGTRTVQASEELAKRFTAAALPHVLLNARYPDQEAEVVAQAGEPGRVTIATNMAGRGTDIRLADSVRDAGGLHVIVTELHPSRRIDRQLLGRCARQGDPGSGKMILSLDDEILDLAQGPDEAKAERHRLSAGPARAREKALLNAQATVETRNAENRILANEAAVQMKESYEHLGLDPVLDRLEDPL